MIRSVTAAALALAIAGWPVMLTWCAESCEAHASAGPSCHHATPAPTRMGRVPASCGHDHSAVGLAGGETARTVRAVDVVVAIETSPAHLRPVSDAREAVAQSSPPSTPALERHSLPLRV
jgi:hypothetical protein